MMPNVIRQTKKHAQNRTKLSKPCGCPEAGTTFAPFFIVLRHGHYQRAPPLLASTNLAWMRRRHGGREIEFDKSTCR
jgi:hypothetical protein